MRKKQRVITTLAAAAVAIASITACGSDGAQTNTADNTETMENSGETTENTTETTDDGADTAEKSAESGKRQVNFYYSTDLANISDQIVEKFNSSQDEIEVIPHTIPESEYDDKIKVMTSGNSDAMDVFWLRSPAQTMQYVENNALVDLKPYADASGIDLSQIAETSLKDITLEDGSFYGLPDKSTCWLLYYNKDLFDEKGMEYPGQLTWSEYAELAASLTSEEGGTKMWGTLIPNWTLNLGAIAHNNYLDDEDLSYTREYAEILHRLYVDDKSAPGLGEMQSGSFDVYAFFNSGNYYTMINGDWTFNFINDDINYGVAPLPIFEDGEPDQNAGNPSYLSIPTTAVNPDDAYTFIEFYCTSPEGTSAIASTGNMPAYVTDEAMDAYGERVNVEGIESRFSAKTHGEDRPNADYQAIKTAFVEEINLYLLDEESLDSAIENFEELREEIVEE